MDHTFDTPAPVELFVDIGSGDITVTATDTDRTVIQLEGRDAEHTQVEQHGRTISVIAPKRRGITFGGAGHALTLTVTLPEGSDLVTEVGSADLQASGVLGSCRLKSGSGEITLEQAAAAELASGSGDIQIGRVSGDLSARTGSGEITVQSVGGTANTVSGSGDVEVGRVDGTLGAKTGSGEVNVTDAHGDLGIVTASGDITVRRMSPGKAEIRAASGDIHLGALSGTPVWTDLNTVSGRISSHLEPLGEPAEGQEFLELRLRTVSGDITLVHTT